jgi:hypothetical protein
VRTLYKPFEDCYRDRLQVEVDLTGIGDDRHNLTNYYMDVYVGGYIAESRKEGCIKDAYVMQRVLLSAWSNPYKTYEFELPDVLPARIRVEIYEKVAGQGKLLDTRETEFNLDVADIEFNVKVFGDRSKNIITAYGIQLLASGNIRTKKKYSATSSPTEVWMSIPDKRSGDRTSIAEALYSVPDFKGKKSITQIKGDPDWSLTRSYFTTCIYDRDRRNNIKYPFRPNNGYIGGRPVPKTITINSTENGPPVRCSN